MKTLFLVLSLSSGLVGVLSIIGTKLRWKKFIEPLEDTPGWVKNDPLFIYKKFGLKGLIVYNYIFSSLFIIFSFFMIIKYAL